MKLCILVNGHFRTFDKNLEKNLLQLYPFLLQNNEVHVYILSLKTENYSPENQDLIIKIFEKYNCIVKYIFYWDDLTIFHKKSQEIDDIYKNDAKHTRGVCPMVGHMFYQTYVFNAIKNQICRDNNLEYDLVCFVRIFDVEFTVIQPNIKNYMEYNLNLCLNHDFLLGCCEFYIGKPSIMDKLFEFGNNFKLFHDDIWNDIQFTSYYTLIDMCLSINRHTYSFEVQIAYYIYINKIKFKSFRYDYTYPDSILNTEKFIQNIHCPVRHIFKQQNLSLK